MRESMPRTRVSEQASGLDLEQIGAILIRVILAVTVIWVGALKFSGYEADDIQPLVANSPLLSWAYGFLSVPAFAAILGTGDIIILFLATVTFLVTIPGVWQPKLGFPFLSPMPGQVLAKDIALFSISIWTAGEALRAVRQRSVRGARA